MLETQTKVQRQARSRLPAILEVDAVVRTAGFTDGAKALQNANADCTWCRSLTCLVGNRLSSPDQGQLTDVGITLFSGVRDTIVLEAALEVMTTSQTANQVAGIGVERLTGGNIKRNLEVSGEVLRTRCATMLGDSEALLAALHR